MAYQKIPALGQAAMAASLPVVIASDQSTITVAMGFAAHDAAATGSPILSGGYASAAAPADVSADGDSVRAWFLRNGAQAVNLTAAGALIPGDATNGLDVDVTRVIPGTSATHLGKAEDAAHASGDTGVMALAVRRDTSAASSGTTGDYEPLSTDATGKLWIVGSVIEDAAETAGGVLLAMGTVRRDTPASSAGTAGDNATLNTDAVGRLWVSGTFAEDAVHASGDYGTYVLAVRTDTLAASSGTTGDYESFKTDSLGALWVRDSGQLVDDAAFTPGTSRVTPVGMQADETSTDSVDEGDIGAPRMTLDRKQIVTPQSHTNGGAVPAKLVSAASTNATSLKASAGQIYSIAAFNINAAVRYLKLYNKASSPTVGTDTPVHVFAIPGATTGGGFTMSFPVGLQFDTGIAYALTTGMADSDTGAVAATEILVNIGYK